MSTPSGGSHAVAGAAEADGAMTSGPSEQSVALRLAVR
jgi:hypothetical protein